MEITLVGELYRKLGVSMMIGAPFDIIWTIVLVLGKSATVDELVEDRNLMP